MPKKAGRSKRPRIARTLPFLTLAIALLYAITFLSMPSLAAPTSAGTITYSGAYNGKITFNSAVCGILGGNLVTFTAPARKRHAPHRLAIRFTGQETPYRIIFGLHGKSPFMRIPRGKPIEGIRVKHENGQWALVFDGLRIRGTGFVADAKTLKQLANAKPKYVTLNGTLHCTNNP